MHTGPDPGRRNLELGSVRQHPPQGLGLPHGALLQQQLQQPRLELRGALRADGGQPVARRRGGTRPRHGHGVDQGTILI